MCQNVKQINFELLKRWGLFILVLQMTETCMEKHVQATIDTALV